MLKKFTDYLMSLRGLAIIGVVVEHTAGWGFTAMFFWTDRYRPVSVPNFDQMGGIAYYGLRVAEMVFNFSLPVFFLVSGYFMQLTYQKEKYLWKKIYSRIERLAIPFIFWSVLMILINISQGSRYTVLSFIRAIITGSSAPPFYFIPALIQLYLLSPLIINQLEKRYLWVLGLTAFIQLFSVGLGYAAILNVNTPVIKQLLFLNNSELFAHHVFWFTLGIAIGLFPEKFFELFERTKWWMLGLSLVTIVLGIVEKELLLTLSGKVWSGRPITLIDQVNMFAVTFTLLAFRDWRLPFAKQFSYLGSKSYGIYLVHFMILIFVAKVIYHLAPIILSNQLIYQIILLSMAITIPLIIMDIAGRFASGRYYTYLFGRK